jgi:hypothetical protein
MRCNTQLPGTSYTRPPHDLTPFLPTTLPGGRIASVEHSAALLVASVRGIVAGVGPIADVALPWRHYTEGALARHSLRTSNVAARSGPGHFYAPGWECLFAPGTRGAEVEEHGRAAADRALLARRVALLDADTLTLPEAPRG